VTFPEQLHGDKIVEHQHLIDEGIDKNLLYIHNTSHHDIEDVSVKHEGRYKTGHVCPGVYQNYVA
jgi:hypothetical protein